VPYIKQEDRLPIPDMIPESAGELNYLFTKLIQEYIDERGGLSYAIINEVVGVLECAKLELYRRLAAPYEDEKRELNGDVY
jgi:hypothetical protein